MNRTLLSKRISSLLAEVSRLSNALCAMNTIDLQRYPENYELLSTDATLRAEQIACRMRHLVYGFTTVQKHEYLTSAANVLGITITAQPGLVEITLPGLLPKKKQRSAEYLADPLDQALGQFTREHPCSRFDSCVICFCHIYAESGGRGRIRDYDNLEMKQLLDIVCAYLMEDDTGLLCDVYNTTELGVEDTTKLCVMDRDLFSSWLEQRQNVLESVSDF